MSSEVGWCGRGGVGSVPSDESGLPGVSGPEDFGASGPEDCGAIIQAVPP
jgi:hypothetical protein